MAATSFAALVAIVAAGLWLSWPAPLGLVLDLTGLGGLPTNPPLPDKPSIAVLPFENMSDDPAQEYFADGITEDLITDLSKIPQIFVISHSSVFTYKGRPTTVEDVGRQLGVRYVVEGSVRKYEGTVRVTAQLIDATSGFHVWSERYDRELADLFSLQAELSETIMASVGLEIREAEIERIRRRPTDSLSAYDALIRGTHELRRFTREGFERARPLIQRAIELDPEYALAYGTLGALYHLEHLQGWNLDPALLERAATLAERALELDPKQPQALNLMGAVAMAEGRMAEAWAFAERTVEADPNWNVAHFVLGLHHAREGRLLEAIRSANRAQRLNPRAPPGELSAIATVNFVVGRTDRALEIWERVRAVNPDAILARIGLVGVYESRGRHEEARVVVQEILRVNPDLSAELAAGLVVYQILDPTRRAELRDQLRSAGLP